MSFIHLFAYLHPLDILNINGVSMSLRHPRIKASVYYIVSNFHFFKDVIIYLKFKKKWNVVY